jgi:hypothetical protein
MFSLLLKYRGSFSIQRETDNINQMITVSELSEYINYSVGRLLGSLWDREKLIPITEEPKRNGNV